MRMYAPVPISLSQLSKRNILACTRGRKKGEQEEARNNIVKQNVEIKQKKKKQSKAKQRRAMSMSTSLRLSQTHPEEMK